eukprot:GHVR01182104.1.p1 GENE.GHVR01182104.1~~GHVR01182104.1.p1  ORF type:complete len:130 (+),score=60.78 GHVR01182104.1:32-421(+)
MGGVCGSKCHSKQEVYQGDRVSNPYISTHQKHNNDNIVNDIVINSIEPNEETSSKIDSDCLIAVAAEEWDAGNLYEDKFSRRSMFLSVEPITMEKSPNNIYNKNIFTTSLREKNNHTHINTHTHTHTHT